MSEDIQLIQGDCMEVMPSLPSNSIDLVLVDLPYGITDCTWELKFDIEKLWIHYKRLLKPKGAVLFTASQPFTSALVMSNLKWFKVEWVWEKNAGSNFGCVKWQPMKEHESVLVFAPGKATYNPIMEERAASGLARVKTVVNYDTNPDVYHGGLNNKISSNRPDLRYPRSIQKCNRERGLHPTQKPVKLMEYFIKTYSNVGETVLDNTMGSGTTGVAAVQLGRKFIGIELDEKYFNIAKNRIEEI